MSQKVLPAKFWIEISAALCRASRLDFPIPSPIFSPENQACKEKDRLNGQLAQSLKVTHLREKTISKMLNRSISYTKITQNIQYPRAEILVIAQKIEV